MPYKVGQTIHGFEVERITRVDELQLTAIELEHKATKAKHLHVARADSNNVFSVGLRTVPPDNSGVPHILEHTTLCGSQRYPARDPFFNMLTRSLATFMNAFTASDFTMYPFATINPKDFDNLLSVYLDAVFFPKLARHDFLQEGWRLEHTVTADQTSPIVFKGVVYNEMKGALSSSDDLFVTRAGQALCEGGVYHNYSGGDPPHIPSLTYEALKRFHSELYHPSNARFYTYGDLPLDHHLAAIETNVLQHFTVKTDIAPVPKQPRWVTPRTVQLTGPPDAMAVDSDRSAKVSIAYLLNDVRDTNEVFALRILSSLLVSGPSSPFYQSLIESGLGSDFAPNTYYDAHGNEASFAVGLTGVSTADIGKVVEAIKSTFESVASKPFDSEQIESILHQVELSLKHQSTKFGLNLVSSISSAWVHGGVCVCVYACMYVCDILTDSTQLMSRTCSV